MSTADGRYDRQVILSSWDRRAQNELGSSDVAVVGCGALGTHTVDYLARAGVGSISIVDRDYIELTNLQRTTLFSESDLGRSKALVAREKIGEINSEVEVEVLSTDLNPANARKILGGHDLILDCTDNLLTRYLINDFSVRYSIPWIYAAVIESQGMTMNIVPDEGPCFRCLFPERPPPGALPTCDTVGVMNTVPPVISSVQVTEAVKYLTQRDLEAGNLCTFDAGTREFSTVKI